MTNVIGALGANAGISADINAPCWLVPGLARFPVKRLISFANGFYDLDKGQLFPHTPHLFNVSATDIAFSPSAPEPVEWLKFLKSLWPRDQQSIDCLQEIFGYLLSSDNSQQKMFFLVGPKRGG